jgi:hypothetical protein|nr:MAG TPA: type-2 restriction enzyme [Ackermannviridae sp.]
MTPDTKLILSANDLIELLTRHGIPLDEEAIYQRDIDEDNFKEFCCELIKKLDITEKE